MLDTNALVSPIEKVTNVFTKLISGCFSGYERWTPSGYVSEVPPKTSRLVLKEKFFELANNTPIHCDADFSPLSADKIVRLFVEKLAQRDNRTYNFTPLYVGLRSHESESIQLADVITGYIRSRIQNGEKPPANLTSLPFDLHLKPSSYKKEGIPPKTAKSYYWIK